MIVLLSFSLVKEVTYFAALRWYRLLSLSSPHPTETLISAVLGSHGAVSVPRVLQHAAFAIIPVSTPIVSPAIKSFIFHSCTDRVLVSSLPVGGSARPGEQGLLGWSSSAGVLLHPGEPKPWSRTSSLSSKSK